jgi:hypothetical protein
VGYILTPLRGSPLTAVLQLIRGTLPKSENYAGDDQVGALDFRAPVCSLRSDVGGGRVASLAAACVDRGGDGFCAVGGDGVQSVGGRFD